MRTSLFLILTMIYTSFIPAMSQTGNASPSSGDLFEKIVLKARTSKDAEFSDPARSPLTPEDIPGFKGLKYYSYNDKYRLTARLEKITDPEVIRMKTTTERKPEYRTFARAHFTIEGKNCQLMIYQPVDLMSEAGFEKYLFLPFTDETSGRETYGGGRFLELTIPEGNTIIIDFNTAYNPYCAYNHKYSCPIPPEENDLPVKIPAGELPLKNPGNH